jgi:hypothetical protein
MQRLETVELSALRAAQENRFEFGEGDEWQGGTAYV